MGIKIFFKKVGNGFKKVIGMLPGKIGMIDKLESFITGVLHGATSAIPNKDLSDKLDNVIDRDNSGFQGVVDRGRDAADSVNHGIGQTREIYDRLQNDYESKIRPIVDEFRKRHPVDLCFYVKPKG